MANGFATGAGRLAATALLVFGFMHAAATARAQATDAASPAAVAELGRFNAAMRGIYADSRAMLLADTRPIIVVGSEDITLIRDGSDVTEPYTPAVYHHLKTVAHVVLGMVGAVSPWPRDGENAPRWVEGFAIIDTRSAALLERIGELGLDAERTDRQRRMLEATRAFIAESARRGSPDRAGFGAYLEEIKPYWLANAMESGRAQLEMLHEVVSGWRAELAAEEWARLRVIVLGPRMPREGNLQMAYFSRLLGADAVGTRLIYAESVFATEPALELLGVMVVDRHLASMVFGDHMRMDRDLLSSAAVVILDELLPGK
jgi:hypothetical protein